MTNKLILGAYEALLFAQYPDYWKLKPMLDEMEKIAPAGKVSIMLANGSRAYFTWGRFSEDDGRKAGEA